MFVLLGYCTVVCCRSLSLTYAFVGVYDQASV